ncbi:carboxylesterase family protein [Rhodococcus sp. NPDC003382]
MTSVSADTGEFAVDTGVVRAEVVEGVVDARGVRYGARLDRADRGSALGPPTTAQSPPTAFPQTGGMLDGILGQALGELPQHEDSFSLRIQAPADSAGLPVLLFVHGGGFTTGSGESRWYDAHDLVRSGRIVLVTVGYRIGALGHLGGSGDADASAQPLRDLEVAARWVRDNIAAFGGDPANITIAGDSAGAWYAHALSVLPQTGGMFARTLLLSMPRLAPLSECDHEARRAAFEDALAPERFATAPVESILAAQRTTALNYRGAGFAFAPAAGPRMPGWLGEPKLSAARLHTSALLVVTTAEETAAFLRTQPAESFSREKLEDFVARSFSAPEAVLDHTAERESAYEQMVLATTLWQFRSVAYDLARSAAVPTRLMRLDVRSSLERALSPHCFTLPFVFGDRHAWRGAPMMEGVDRDTFECVRAAFRDAIVPFVRDGSGTAPVWRPESPRLLAVEEDGARVVAPGDLTVTAVTEGSVGRTGRKR